MMRNDEAAGRNMGQFFGGRDRPLRAAVGGTGVGVVMVLVAACSSQPARAPIDVFADRSQGVVARGAALAALEQEAATNPSLAQTLRQSLMEVLWSPAQPRALRRAALAKLAADESGLAMVRSDGQGLVVREPDPVMVAELCDLAGAKQWKEWMPSLIRVWAREGGSLIADMPGVSDTDKEFIKSRDWKFATSAQRAIAAIDSGTAVHSILWMYVVDQPAGLADAALVRRDAYSVLARRDASGVHTKQLLAGAAPSSADGKRVVEALRAGLSDLRVLPNSGEELRWLLELSERKSDAQKAWWNEASQAVQRLSADVPLELRHLEALRWASVHTPHLFKSDRSSLAADIWSRLAVRYRVSRSWGSSSKPYTEDGATAGMPSSQALPSLSMADLICVAVIDQVIGDAASASRLLQQAALDNADRASEYGGLILSLNGGAMTPVLYPPRAKDKRGDLEFHAPDDMVGDQTWALAHFHFHATATSNKDAAGPSVEDLGYARAWGRACVVFTSAGKGRLNVDYYQPSVDDSQGVVVDLGTITEAGFEKTK